MRFLTAVLVVGWLLLLVNATQVTSVSSPASYSPLLMPAHPCYTPPTIPPPNPSPPISQAIRLNEVLPNPHSQWNCNSPDLTSSIWIELYNQSSTAANLYGAGNYFLINSDPQINRFSIGNSIPARGFFVLFPFVNKMINSGSIPLLKIQLYINNTLADQVTIPALSFSQATDNSYARTIDGAGNWQVNDAPTIGSSNISAPPSPTPTPTPSPTPTPHKTATPSPGHKKSPTPSPDPTKSTSSQGTIGKMQAPWSQIHYPSTPSISSNPVAKVQATPTPNARSSPPAGDLPRKLTLTLLLISLGGALYWCAKCFNIL